MKKQKGFTLIEMLIVVAIIGVLSALILVGLGSFRSRGRDARRIADVKQVQNALEVYYTKNLKYPEVLGGAGDRWSELTSLITEGGIGISQLPEDPLSPSQSYDYKDCNNQQGYVIAATLEDADNTALDNDINNDDATTACSFSGTVDCDGSVYCVMF
jgi:general secretion pathway protein G